MRAEQVCLLSVHMFPVSHFLYRSALWLLRFSVLMSEAAASRSTENNVSCFQEAAWQSREWVDRVDRSLIPEDAGCEAGVLQPRSLEHRKIHA